MARILAYTSPARGHLYPLTAILDALHDRGHDIAVRTLAAAVPLLEARGFAAAAIDPAVESIALQDWRERSAQRALGAAVRAFTARALYDASDLRAAIAAERPDAVIVDVNAWGALAAAEQSGKPWATFCPYPLALRSADAPPFGPGLPPARGAVGRLRDRLVRPLVLGTLDRQMLPPFNQVRAGIRLAPLQHLDDMFVQPPLMLYLTAEPFEYPRSDWPANVVMVGPCAWEPPGESPSWLADVERPIVLVTTSSEFQDDGRLVRTALAALADRPVLVVATLPAGDPAAFDVPSNARVERFVPHGAVLDRAVCAVTHGGMGATQKALAHGVPVCAVPFGRDQFEVARRVEVAGAGTRLPAKRLNAERLSRKIVEAMRLSAGAQRVADGFRAAGGPAAAADAVEQRLLRTTGLPL